MGKPLEARATIAHFEAQPDAAVLHAEHAWTADGASDGLHGDAQPIHLGLVPVLHAQFRTDLGRAELEAATHARFENLLPSGILREAELGGLERHELQGPWFLGELGLVQDFAAPVGDATSGGLERRGHGAGVLVPADLDRAPDGYAGRYLVRALEPGDVAEHAL